MLYQCSFILEQNVRSVYDPFWKDSSISIISYISWRITLEHSVRPLYRSFSNKMFDHTALLFACCRCTAIDEHILSSAFITLHKNTNFSNTSPDWGRKRYLIKLESILYHHQRDQMMEYKLPNFPQNCPRSSRIMKVGLFKIAQTLSQIFWAAFVRKMSPRSSKNPPIWSHWSPSSYLA